LHLEANANSVEMAEIRLKDKQRHRITSRVRLENLAIGFARNAATTILRLELNANGVMNQKATLK
jgi:hypothetical protein